MGVRHARRRRQTRSKRISEDWRDLSCPCAWPVLQRRYRPVDRLGCFLDRPGRPRHSSFTRTLNRNATRLRWSPALVSAPPVTRILDRLAVERGLPQLLRTDNRLEFCGRAMLTWTHDRRRHPPAHRTGLDPVS